MKENYKENSSWLGELMKHYEIGPLSMFCPSSS